MRRLSQFGRELAIALFWTFIANPAVWLLLFFAHR